MIGDTDTRPKMFAHEKYRPNVKRHREGLSTEEPVNLAAHPTLAEADAAREMRNLPASASDEMKRAEEAIETARRSAIDAEYAAIFDQ